MSKQRFMQNGIKWNTQGSFNVDLNLRTTRQNPTLINSCPMATSNFALSIDTIMTKNL